MSRTTTSSDGWRREWQWLPLPAVALSWLVFVSRYAYFPLRFLHRTMPGIESLLVGVHRVLYPGDLLFTRLWLYLVLSVLGLILVIAALVPSGLARAGSAFGGPVGDCHLPDRSSISTGDSCGARVRSTGDHATRSACRCGEEHAGGGRNARV